MRSSPTIAPLAQSLSQEPHDCLANPQARSCRNPQMRNGSPRSEPTTSTTATYATAEPTAPARESPAPVNDRTARYATCTKALSPDRQYPGRWYRFARAISSSEKYARGSGSFANARAPTTPGAPRSPAR
jgi:hypothetical protein